MDKIMEACGFRIAVSWKNVKNINLRVRPPAGEISLSAPFGMPESALRDFIRAHLAWLGKQKAKFTQLQPPQDHMAYWGRLLPLQIEKHAGRALILAEEERIKIFLPAAAQPGNLERLIAQWRKRQVLEKAAPLLGSWQKKMGLAGIQMLCRLMKTRWGSCASHKNRITLNSALSEKPLPCLELVVVHELVHFFVPNHGKGFYRRLAAALPDWRERALILKSPRF